MNDIHETPAEDLGIMAGIGHFNIIIKSSKWTLFTELELMVPLFDKRGVHMSRLIFPERVECESVEQFIEDVGKTVHERINTIPYIKMTFKFPWRDQFPTIIVENGRNKFFLYYTYVFKGITACPCSKEFMGIGHMQKCELTVKIHTNLSMVPKFEDMFKLMDKCFSATLTEKLKRAEEAAKIVEAQSNAKFVEDVVRSAVKTIPDIVYARAESDESIHAHRAIAEWGVR